MRSDTARPTRAAQKDPHVSGSKDGRGIDFVIQRSVGVEEPVNNVVVQHFCLPRDQVKYGSTLDRKKLTQTLERVRTREAKLSHNRVIR